LGKQREPALLVVANQAVLTGEIRRRTAVKRLFTIRLAKNSSTARN